MRCEWSLGVSRNSLRLYNIQTEHMPDLHCEGASMGSDFFKESPRARPRTHKSEAPGGALPASKVKEVLICLAALLLCLDAGMCVAGKWLHIH